MTLPLLLSVPHAGLRIPAEAAPYCRLTRDEIIADGDEGAREIFHLEQHVASFVTSDVARAIVDFNRSETDRGADGVVKTHTCWGVAVYREFPPSDVIEQLLDRYYRPYHSRLSDPPADNILLGVDCHTMAAVGPPVAADAGKPRPHVCLSDADSTTLPAGWMERLVNCFREAFGNEVQVNQPFHGGHITRTYAHRRPWVQVELTRAPFLTHREKRERVLGALTSFCSLV